MEVSTSTAAHIQWNDISMVMHARKIDIKSLQCWRNRFTFFSDQPQRCSRHLNLPMLQAKLKRSKTPMPNMGIFKIYPAHLALNHKWSKKIDHLTPLCSPWRGWNCGKSRPIKSLNKASWLFELLQHGSKLCTCHARLCHLSQAQASIKPKSSQMGNFRIHTEKWGPGSLTQLHTNVAECGLIFNPLQPGHASLNFKNKLT